MRLEACASAGDVIALNERRASTAAIKGVHRLKRNENGFICEGFRLLGGKIFWASRLHCSRGSPAQGRDRLLPLFWESSRGLLVRGAWIGWPHHFFKWLAARGGRASGETGHTIDSLLEWRRSPQNNNRTS